MQAIYRAGQDVHTVCMYIQYRYVLGCMYVCTPSKISVKIPIPYGNLLFLSGITLQWLHSKL